MSHYLFPLPISITYHRLSDVAIMGHRRHLLAPYLVYI